MSGSKLPRWLCSLTYSMTNRQIILSPETLSAVLKELLKRIRIPQVGASEQAVVSQMARRTEEGNEAIRCP
jgi:hypothetical protein